MKEKDKNLWLELYEVAKNIQKLEPWKYLWDQDLLGYISKEYNNIFFCSVMGKAGIHRALAIYEGEKINGFYELSDKNYPEYMLLNYQECIVCNFSRIDEVLPENKKIIKDLGIKFREHGFLLNIWRKDMNQVI